MSRSFSDTLKDLRINAGYTQKQVYEMLNVRQSTFSSWETGRAEPSADMLLKLCKLYKVSDIFTAFGYDGYKEDGSLLLNMNEIDIIEKYRALDTHGKKMVDFTLDNEYQRSISIANVEVLMPEKDYSIPIAAHERTDIEVTDEMRKHDDDIMNDDNF